MSDWKTKHFAREVLQKSTFAEVGRMIPRSIFHDLDGLGTDFHVDLGILGAQTCYLACLVATLWRPGRRWGDPGTLGSKKKDTLRFRLGLLLIFTDLVTPFW